MLIMGGIPILLFVWRGGVGGSKIINMGWGNTLPFAENYLIISTSSIGEEFKTYMANVIPCYHAEKLCMFAVVMCWYFSGN